MFTSGPSRREKPPRFWVTSGGSPKSAEIHSLLPPFSHTVCLFNRPEHAADTCHVRLNGHDHAASSLGRQQGGAAHGRHHLHHAQKQQFKPPPPAANVTASCVPHERDALLAFKRGITNDTAKLLESWRPGEEDCCRWTGVACSDKSGNVIALNLNGETSPPALVGEISPSLLSLDHLDLSTNSLEGPNGGGVPAGVLGFYEQPEASRSLLHTLHR
jgi:hypothetical protein